MTIFVEMVAQYALAMRNSRAIRNETAAANAVRAESQ
jgi:hypothetical protein